MWGPPGGWPSQGDPNAGASVPLPYARKPSIVDRVMGRLFPTAQYAGLLDPGQQQGLQRQGLLQVGLNLLQAGGRSPHQAGTLANIGSSIQGVNFPEMAQQALQMQAYRQQQAGQQAIAQVAGRHPPQPGESREQAYDRLTAIASEIASIPGGAAIAEKFAPLLQALKPDKPSAADRARWSFQTVNENGQNVLYRINEDTGVRYRVGLAESNVARGNPKQVEHAEFGTAALAAWRTVEQIRQKNPNVETEVGKIMTSPAFVTAIPGFRHASDAVMAIQKAGGSADAQNYMRAKWPFLDNIIRTRIPGGRMNGQYMAQVTQEFMPGLDVEANAQMKMNEIQAILTAQGEAGFDENPDLWNKAAKRHGVSNLDLQAILNGGGIDSRINTIQGRYR